MKILINIAAEQVGGIAAVTQTFITECTKNHTDIELHGIVIIRNQAQESIYQAIQHTHNLKSCFKISIIGRDINTAIEHTTDLEMIKTFYKQELSAMKKYISEINPDKVIVNGTYSLPWLIATAAHSVHLPVVLWYAGVLALEALHMNSKSRSMRLLIEKNLIQISNKIIFPSLLAQNTVSKLMNNPLILEKSCVIYNALPSEYTALPIVNKNNTEIKKPILALVARFNTIKNVQLFFEIHKKLLSHSFQHRAIFVSSGNKNKQDLIPDSIEQVGPYDLQEMSTFYHQCNLVIVPSLFETFGNVAVEALSLGVPVLIGTEVGCAEILRTTGLHYMITDWKDLDEVERKIDYCIRHPPKPTQIEQIRKILHATKLTQDLLKVINSASN